MNTAYNNATEAFEALYMYIMNSGVPTRLGTKAAYNVGFYILNPKERVITTEWRKFSKKYAEREWAWYLSGDRSVEEIKKFAPMWDKMHGGDNIVNSNYGWQWMRNGQLAKCIEQLKENKHTRQAWLTIFDGKEKDDYTYDTPCTLSIGFDIKPGIGTLDMCVTMRSNDLVYGFCNDQYCFTKLQELVADELGIPVGTYYHFAHDLHIYERHFDMCTSQTYCWFEATDDDQTNQILYNRLCELNGLEKQPMRAKNGKIICIDGEIEFVPSFCRSPEMEHKVAKLKQRLAKMKGLELTVKKD